MKYTILFCILKFSGYFVAPACLLSVTILEIDNIICILIGAVSLSTSVSITYTSFRRNTAATSPLLDTDSFVVVDDGAHNANTDMVFWQEKFFLVHTSSPFHFASRSCELVIHQSDDLLTWTEVTRIKIEGYDIRDPKFAPINERLFLYFMLNRATNPEPFTTVYTFSENGQTWEPVQSIGHEGWLFWRPKSPDSYTWYVPAYWWKHGRAILLKSTDGVYWTRVAEINTGGRNDETAIEFGTDGRLCAIARLEYSDCPLGDYRASTKVLGSVKPYKKWAEKYESRLTRLDGPVLFAVSNHIFAVGRYQPEVGRILNRSGSVFSKKRTALFLLREGELVYLSDLPSSGDTSYGAAIVHGDTLYISYYTSRIDRDFLWFEGMTNPTHIRIAKIRVEDIENLAVSSEKQRHTMHS